MGPTLKFPTTYSAGADWTTPGNVLVEDGNTAADLNVGPGGGGVTPTQLATAGYGFAIPASAVIDGIKLEAKVSSGFSGDSAISVGNNTKSSFATPNFGQGWPNALTWLTWGGPTALWGKNWTPADINDSSFGGSVSGFPSHATDNTAVDAMRITVYWHVSAQDVPKRYLYKVFNSIGTYLGVLPNVVSEFEFQQDIDTAGAQITIDCGISPDTSRQAPGTMPIVAPGGSVADALIKNGNTLQVFEYGYYWPNGKCMFNGQMERWEADFGGDGGNDTIRILAYSDGQDLDNYLIRGNPYTYTLDQANTTQNTALTIYQGAGIANWNRYGQTWKVGTGVTNVGAINLLLYGTADVTVTIYDSVALANVLGVITKSVALGGPAVVTFAFPTTVKVVAGTTYFFEVKVGDGQSIYIYAQNTNVYANGDAYNSNYGGSGGGGYAGFGSDLYFQTYSGAGSTIGTFTALDPTTGMLEAIMDDYNARGGLITYDSSTIDPTALSLTYGFNTNTIYEGLRAVRTMAPDGFYYYVDLGTDVLHFKKASLTADIVITKGRHINTLKFVATIENLKNQVYFTGGQISGVNLYRVYQDATSVNRYGTKLERKTDNRVIVNATADAIGGSAVAEQKDESYQTTVTVVDKTMDTTLLKPGLVIGFNGFGTFVDNVLAQIVGVHYTPELVTLTLGLLPKRLTPEFDRITRGLIAEQTIFNPATPS